MSSHRAFAGWFGLKSPRALWWFAAADFVASTVACPAATVTNALAAPVPPLPDAGAAFLRVMGALLVVFAVFLGGTWLLRNWQRLMAQRSGHQPKLQVLEVRPLGGRHALYVIRYETQRMLLATSPTGVNYLSELPPADPATENQLPPAPGTGQSFAQTLQKVISKQ